MCGLQVCTKDKLFDPMVEMSSLLTPEEKTEVGDWPDSWGSNYKELMVWCFQIPWEHMTCDGRRLL